MSEGQIPFSYLCDSINTPVRIVAGSQEEVSVYDEFGIDLMKVGSNLKIHNPFGFAGEQTDLRSVYLRNRNYSPVTGRFLAEDSFKAGKNWYTYCNSNPIRFIDPMGLDAILINKPTEHGFTHNMGIEHMSILFQDENNNWYYNSFYNEYFISELIPQDVDTTDLSDLNEWIRTQEKFEYDDIIYDFTRITYVEGDFTASLDQAQKYSKNITLIEYNPYPHQSLVDWLAEKVSKETFSAQYSPLYNSCGTVAIELFKLGVMPDSDKTYGQQMKWDEIVSQTFRSRYSQGNHTGFEFLLPNGMFDFVDYFYAKELENDCS